LQTIIFFSHYLILLCFWAWIFIAYNALGGVCYSYTIIKGRNEQESCA
ncbi:MAG: hypothetical protein RIS11_1854, partial [Pseudomonadota bacterium]